MQTHTQTQTQLCELSIDGEPFSFPVSGEFAWGDDQVLFDQNGVLANAPWRQAGYGVAEIFSEAERRDLVAGTGEILTRIFRELGYEVPAGFQPQDYHRVVTTAAAHQEVIRRTRTLSNRDFPLSVDDIADRVSRVVGRRLSAHNPLLKALGHPAEVVILRISRPNSLDINPPHRDGYLEIWKQTLNLWIAVAGCEGRSSLPVLPESHWWNEKDVCRTAARGASINGLTYHVPAILKTRLGLHMIRPTPRAGEILLFSPFLIHGAAVNQNPDTTRVSFELRLFDAEARPA